MITTRSIVVTLSLILLLACIGALGDPCTTYTSINDHRRSTAYNLSNGESPICDRYLRTGWYRFISNAGGIMPTVKANVKSCGTLNPIWLNGVHPTVSEGEVTRTACINQFDRNNGCARTQAIKIKNCNDEYFVYELQRLRFCSAAYCAGDKLVCPFGTVPPDCKVAFPTTIPTPKITFRAKQFEPDPETSGLWMLCSWDFPAWTNTTFYVEWFVNQVSKKNVTITDANVREAHLESGYNPSDLSSYEFKPGDTLMCRLKACFSPCTLLSPFEESEPFFVGIEITPNQEVIQLEECKTTNTKEFTIHLRPTVPIRCGYAWSCSELGGSKGIQLFMYFGESPDDVSAEGCFLTFPESEETDNVYNLSVKAVCDNIDDGDKQLKIEFSLSTHPFWGEYKLLSMLVSVKDRRSKTCHATTDPNYISFDGKYFAFMGVGDFVMYANKKRDFEVHTRQWLCWSGVSCSCGVAIREKNDVITFSFCDDKGPIEYWNQRPTILTVKVRSKRPLAAGTKIIRENMGQNSKFTIFLPSGAKIQLQRSAAWFNVHVTAPVGDAGDTEGICGDFNDDPDNDFEKAGDNIPKNTPTEFGNSWRLPYGQSYFDKLPSGEFLEVPEAQKCICKMDKITKKPKVDCGFNKDVNHPHFPNAHQGNDITNTLNPENTLRKRRSTNELPDFDDEDDNEIEYISNVRSFAPLVEPPPVSRENATQYCEKVVLDNDAARACKSMPGINMNISVQTCISDLVYTGDYQMASSAVDLMMSQCEEIALKNVSLYENSTDGEMIPPMYIAERLCPNDCSEHGACINGTCICDEDFTAGDCSMSVNQVPLLYGVTGRGLCDVRKRSCKLARVIGTGFLDSNNLTCHISEFTVISSPWTPSSQSLPHLATMTDLMEVQCQLPDSPVIVGNYEQEGVSAAGLKIAVSNNRIDESTEVKLIVHDSVCQKCNITTVSCTLKTNSCIINGHCYGAGGINPSNKCEECVPTLSQTQWNERQVNLPPNVTSPSDLYLVQDEFLSIQLYAQDPENMLLTYSLLGSIPAGSQLSSSGLLNWKASVNTTIGIKVEDECKAVQLFNLTVNIISCHCLHNGTCIQDASFPQGTGHYLCQCHPEYNGSRCQADVDECVSSPCAHGTCANKVPGFKCLCEPEYTGRLCDKKIVPCSDNPCYPEVLCKDTPQGGVCGACPEWMTGNGEHCEDLEPPVVYKAEVRMMDEEWHADLVDFNSQRFKNLSAVCQTKISGVYKGVADFRTAKVTRFRSGSVIVEFSLMFSKNHDKPLKPLMDEIQDGSLVDIKVDKSSLKLKTLPEKPKESGKGTNHSLIIGAVCGGMVFLGACLFIGFLCTRSKIKRKTTVLSHSVQDNPTEGLHNNSYETLELERSRPPLPPSLSRE